MSFEAAILLAHAVTIGALIYVAIVILTLQQTIERHLTRIDDAAKAKQSLYQPIPFPPVAPAAPKAKRVYVRKPKAQPTPEPGPNESLGFDIDPRQLEIKP
jgi:hypothetical protein